MAREMEEFEAFSMTIMEVSSWLEVAVWGLANSTRFSDMAKGHHLFIARSQTVEFLRTLL